MFTKKYKWDKTTSIEDLLRRLLHQLNPVKSSYDSWDDLPSGEWSGAGGNHGLDIPIDSINVYFQDVPREKADPNDM